MHDDILPLAGEDPMRDEDCAGPDCDPADEMFELELDGVTHTVPAALKGAFLRQADYTRKTQEIAEHRRALEAEREAMSRRSAALRSGSRDRISLMVLDDQIEAFESVDWEAYAASDPEAAQALWVQFQEALAARDELAYAVAHDDERAQLQAAREAAEAMAKTGARLREEIEGWSPEVASKLVDYAQAFGVTLEELAQAADPRLWKLLHKAWTADETSQRGAQAEAAHAVRPAVLVSGGGAGGAGVRDELSTKEWMRRRGEQLSGGR